MKFLKQTLRGLMHVGLTIVAAGITAVVGIGLCDLIGRLLPTRWVIAIVSQWNLSERWGVPQVITLKGPDYAAAGGVVLLLFVFFVMFLHWAGEEAE